MRPPWRGFAPVLEMALQTHGPGVFVQITENGVIHAGHLLRLQTCSDDYIAERFGALDAILEEGPQIHLDFVTAVEVPHA